MTRREHALVSFASFIGQQSEKRGYFNIRVCLLYRFGILIPVGRIAKPKLLHPNNLPIPDLVPDVAFIAHGDHARVRLASLMLAILVSLNATD